MQTPEEIGKLQIQSSAGLVALNQVATVVDTTKKQTSLDKYNGKTAVSLLISKSSTANEIRVSEQVRKDPQYDQAKAFCREYIRSYRPSAEATPR